MPAADGPDLEAVVRLGAPLRPPRTTGPGGDAPGIAIIGIGCRFPGARDPGAFWDNLCRGVDSITALSDAELLAAGNDPALLAHPGYVKAAALLDGADGFDAAFFGYSPREAATMDPQQRLFLEVAWEAFENAGYAPDECPGVAGVFAGGGGVVTSYLAAHPGHPALHGQTASLQHLGNDKDFLSTRVSYKLDLTGPSVTVQTACSTSLVAVHLACQSLRAGECDVALAGASTVRIPQVTGYLAEKGNVHSLDGRCRAFDAAAQGTIFGSGVAAVLLKPVDRALADGDRIHAVIRGSAVNNDGGRKVSYTAPSVAGQARAMVEALTRAGITPDTLDYVECHATGTALGDPLEIEALARAFRVWTDRRQYCAVGSVKTNIGHPEQAAGLAGLIKTALMLRHRLLPPSLHHATPNPRIDFAGSPFFVNTALRPWPDTGRPRRAAVNSLGIGGTNAFVVLEESPAAVPAAASPARGAHVLTLSARTASALAAYAARVRDALAGAADADLPDLCYTSNVSRGRMAHRLAAVGATVEEVRAQLAAAAPGAAAGPPRDREPRVAFLFTGQGSQYDGMAVALYGAHPVFRDALDRCDALLRPALGRSLLALLSGADARARLDDTGYTQPALFAVGWALAELWRSWGIRPAAVLGHSIGELTAACVAGALALEDAVRLVSERARLMQALPAGGAMAAVLAGEAVVEDVLGQAGGRVAIAAINAPDSTVVSGDEAAVAAVVSRLAGRGVQARRLAVSHAFHSPLMDPMLGAFEDVARGIPGRAPDVPLVSNLTGEPLGGAPDATHWRRHAREPVRFAAGVQALAALACDAFLELGPGRTLLAMARRTLGAGTALWRPSLLPQGDDWRTVLEAAGALHAAGASIDWPAVHRGAGRRRADLPTYPFEHRRYWVEGAPPGPPHPLLGRRAPAPGGGIAFEAVYDLDRLGYLRDHRIGGAVVLPTAAAVEAAQAAGRAFFGVERVGLEDLVYHEALLIAEGAGPRVRLAVTPQPAGGAAFSLMAATAGEPWRTHLSGRVAPAAAAGPPAGRAPDDPCDEAIAAESFYAALRDLGLDYGPAFRGLRRLRRGGNQAIGEIHLPTSVAPDGYALHPVLLDACFHVYPALLAPGGDAAARPGTGPAFLPVGIERFTLHRDGVRRIWTRAALRAGRPDRDTLVVDIRVHGEDGDVVAVVEGLCLRRLGPWGARDAAHRPGPAAPAAAAPDPARRTRPPVEPALPGPGEGGERAPLEWLHRVRWEERARPARAGAGPGTWIVLADRGGFGDAVIAALRRRGQRCHRLAGAAGEAQPGDVERRLAAVPAAPSAPLRGVIYLWALDAPALDDVAGPDLEPAIARALGGALDLARSLAASRSGAGPAARLWLATANAQAVRPGRDAVEPVQALLWGFGRTVAVEAPAVWGGLLDVPASSPDAATALVDEVLGGGEDDQVAFRDGRRFVPRLHRLRPDEWPARASRVPAGATYLVSGAFGMIGLRTARWLVEEQGARCLVLTGRSGARGAAQDAVRQLEARGAAVRVVAADAAVPADVERVVATLRGLPPLRGVVHCAGVLDDGILPQMSWPRLWRVLAPKVMGAWLLHRHAGAGALDFFLLHSSLLGVTGAAGQSNYTAANAFLDALAAHRRARGLPGLAVNWGPWDEEGMARASGARGEAMWKARGVRYLPPGPATRLFAHLLASGEDHLVVADVDWTTFAGQYAARPPFYGPVLDGAAALPEASRPGGGDIRTRLRAAEPGARRSLLIDFVRSQVTRELGFEAPIDVRRPLGELGLDSLLSVEVANRLETALAVAVPVVKLIQGPSVEQLVEDILPDVLRAAGVQDAAGPAAPAAPAVVASEHVTGDGWLVLPRRRPAARARLFCFPFAGGGAATFRAWTEGLDPGIELVAVDPPGRGGRIGEPPVTRLEDFIAALLPRVAPLLDRPAVFFGHCLGALLAYELARPLLGDGRLALRHLVVSGARPPDRVARHERFEARLAGRLLELPQFDPRRAPHEQPDDVFAEMIRHFNIGATEEFLLRPELRRLLLPAVRADFALVANYRPAPEPPWRVPITCVVGLDDPYVPRDDAVAWSRYTQGDFRLHVRDANHFLVVDDRAFLVDLVNALAEGP